MKKQTIWNLIKRTTAILLAASMISAEFPMNIMAEEVSVMSEETSVSSNFVMNVNGQSAKLPTAGSFDSALTFTYGDSLSTSLINTPNSDSATVNFYYVEDAQYNGEDTPWIPWSSDSYPVEGGNYYVGYYYSDTNNGIGFRQDDNTYGITIQKAVLAAPENPSWKDGTTATWSAVNQTMQRKSLDSGLPSSYEVTLLKDGNSVGTYTTSATSYNLIDEIQTKGMGTYTYTVKALAGDSKNYADSAASDASAAEHAVEITVEKTIGISAVAPTTKTLLIEGVTDQNTMSVTATVSQGWGFGQWASSDDNIQVAANEADATKATITLGEGYKGANAVTITAQAKDVLVPMIESFAAGTYEDNKYGTFIGMAKDDETGIAAYAYSVATTTEEIPDTEWKAVEGTTAGEMVSCEWTVDAAGIYYLYVKDAAGNITKSSDSIQATKVICHDYLGEDGVSDKATFLVGNEPLKLAEQGLRSGYTFEGWYADKDYSGEAITSVSNHSNVDKDVYAKWTRVAINFTEQPEAYSGTYDGQEHTLRAEVSNYGTISYRWYKDDVAIDGATDSSYTVKNASDSGDYKVEVTVTIDGDEKLSYSDEVPVEIKKVNLILQAEDKSITYGEDAPTYTYTLSGFVNDEDEESAGVTASGFQCDYKKGNKAGTYPITFSSDFQAENYSFTVNSGTLTVQEKDVNAEGSQVTVIRTDDTALIYTGEAITPGLTVKDGEAALTEGTDYTITYTNHVSAGTAKATVTFQGNYAGTKTIEYQITKATYTSEVWLDGWTYGETAETPKLSTQKGTGSVSYYYFPKDGVREEATTTQPTDAGIYEVYGVIAADNNYEACTTKIKEFTIEQRKITITANSRKWEFDGNSHSDLTYITEGTFAGSDQFQSVSVTGSITDVGTVDNVITYVLSDATKAENYEITAKKGTLTVTKRKLAVPANIKWSTKTPGTIEWVAVTKEGLIVSYVAELYRAGETVDTLVSTATEITGTSCSFADVMRTDSATNGEGSYYVKVKAVPAGGVNKENYAESDASNHSGKIYTATVTTTAGTGVASAAFAGVEGTTSVVLIQGESVDIQAEAESGYSLSKPVWTAVSQLLTFGDADEQNTTVTLSSKMTEPLSSVIYAGASDDKPEIGNFTATAKPLAGNVEFTLQAQDTKGIVAWAITNSASEPEAAQWNSLSVSVKTINEPVTKASEGAYYAWVKDDNGNVTGCADPIQIYRITFDGNGGLATESMRPIYKVENEAILLPLNTYINSESAFQNWKGATGYYKDAGSYSANQSDTLYAQWTSQHYNYQVEYYLMGTDGQYPEAASSTAAFTGVAGTTIASSDAAVALSTSTMTYDSEKSSSITLTDDQQVLKVYYQRNQYKLTYSYQNSDGKPVNEVDEFYYGEEVAYRDLPTAAGYTFVGWLYEESGKLPETMPNKDITATGSFAANTTSYQINYYKENLSAAGTYELAETLTDTIAATHGDAITMSTSDAKEITGFEAKGITVSYGAAGGSTPGSEELKTENTGTVSGTESQQLEMNIYYARKTYDLTLNVQKGENVLASSKIYTHTWNLQYGQIIDAATYENYDRDNWGKEADLSGYTLAEYVGWSTGTLAPSTMPAGDVTITREYIKAVESPYQLEVYYENADGTYGKTATLNYYGSVGSKVTVGGEDSDTINYNKLGSSIWNLGYYQYIAKDESVTEGTVTKDGETPLVLKIYFERKTVDTTIIYYYSNGNAETQIGSVTKSGKWGTEYNYEPLSLFNGTGIPESWSGEKSYEIIDGTIDGTNYANYNFCRNAYLVTYSRVYNMNGVNNYQTKKFTEETDLDGTYSGIYGQTNNQVKVYYSKIDRDKTYALDLKYNPRTLKGATGEEVQNVTTTYNDKNYKIKVVNEVDLYSDPTYTDGIGSTSYPGMNQLKRTYDLANASLKNGITKVTINEKVYYLNSADPDYIYSADSSNQYFYGNWVDFKYTSGYLGYDSIEQYLTEYKKKQAASGPDTEYEAAYIYGNHFSGIYYGDDESVYSYTMIFDYHETYSVSYCMNGNTYTDTTKYAQGAQVTPGCDSTIFPKKDGYQIVWYTDTTYTKAAEPFTINGNTTFYGRYEKETVISHAYVSYQLRNDITATTGEKISYITSANKDLILGVTSTSDEETEVTSYYYDGELVLTDTKISGLSYSSVTLDRASYEKTGFTLDESNAGNVLQGYCQSTPITLSAYYARNTYELTVYENNTKENNATVRIMRYGQNISLTDPTKKGYKFTEWKWTKADDTAAEATYQNMPDYDLTASAQWTAADFDRTITHFFQEVTQTYDTESYKTMKGMTGTEGSFKVDGEIVSGTIYGSGENVIGASQAVGGYVYYYTTKNQTGSVLSFDAGDLIAVDEKGTFTSETSVKVADKILPNLSVYAYGFTVHQQDTKIQRIGREDAFTASADMNVEFYYTRANNYTVTVDSKATDGGATGTTVTGADTCYYGEKLTLHAVISAGYTFKGWYRSSDFTDGTLEEAAVAQYTDPTWTMAVKASADYIALVEPEAPADASVSIAGNNSYEYGYAMSAGNALSAVVVMPEGASSTNYVASYQWYEGTESIAGATSSTYTFPTGKDQGSYTYSCAVVIQRRDNGRSVTKKATDYTVTVNPTGVKVKVQNYAGIYDSKEHSMKLSIEQPDASDYTIYYGTTELTGENYNTQGSTKNPGFKDVKVDEQSAVVPYTVYYYLKSRNQNYSDAYGSGTVTISPKTVTLSEVKAFSKEYDGTETVGDNEYTEGTDKYRLATGGYYTVSGMYDNDESTYLVDFDAVFNSKDVKSATTLTMKPHAIIQKHEDNTVTVNSNYMFEKEDTFVMAGYITPFQLEITWGERTSLEYNGTLQAPTAALETRITPEVIQFDVLGKQTNVGSYTAYVSVEQSDAYESSNYAFQTDSCDYSITKRSISICPKEQVGTYTYNGSTQYLPQEYSITNGSLVEGQTYTSVMDKGGKAAGTYTVTATGTKIYDTSKKDVSDNYAITQESTILTIHPKVLTVSGVEVKDKTYDGTTTAEIDRTSMAVDGVVGNDEVTIGSITGTFTDKNAGENKAVTLTIPAALEGAASGNYKLNLDGSQQEATASIKKAVITVTGQDQSVVYGEETTFSATFSGIVAGESEDVITEKTLSYRVGYSNTYFDYAPTCSAGTYQIRIDISQLQADNYTFEAAKEQTLTVTKRPVTVTSTGIDATTPISKVYDGKTDATVDSSYYTFSGVAGDTASGIVNDDRLVLGFTASYNSKNVDEAQTVSLSGLTIDNSNYELKTTGLKLKGQITSKDMSIRVKDKTITYGDANPASFEVQGSGYVTGESGSSALTGAPHFVSTYDCDDSVKRDVGTYEVSVSGYTSKNRNYTISYEKGTLTVTQATLTVKASDKLTITYGVDTLPNYNEASNYSITGYQYEDTRETSDFSGESNMTCNASVASDQRSEAGEYVIYAAGNFACKNYKFVYENGKLTIEKRVITISGITVADKVYDGTVNVDETAIHLNALDFGNEILENDRAQAGLKNVAATFDDANVSTEPITVRLSYELNDYLMTRYYFEDNSGCQKTTTAKITPKDLTIAAVDQTIGYGDAAPTYTERYDGFVNGEDKTNLLGSLNLLCSYESNNLAGTYAITPSGYTSNNYHIIYNPGTLTVTSQTLETPAPSWSEDTPGTITWNPIAGIGEVSVKEYQVVLYKKGVGTTDEAIDTQTVAASTEPLQYNFLETLRSKGAGSYYVTVKAVADANHNMAQDASKKNVNDSNEGQSALIYAAKVIPQFAADEKTNAGKKTTDGKDVIGITNDKAASYVVIAGEKNIPISAELTNETGYEVKSWTSSQEALTISDETQSKDQVSGRVSVGKELTTSEDIVVTLTLDAVKATLAANVTADQNKITYGYTTAPVLTANPSVQKDNITEDGYEYTYQWQYKAGMGATTVNIAEATNAAYTIPLGMNAAIDKYQYRCVVTATRKDNGMSTTVTTAFGVIHILRANLTDETTNVVLPGWTYGNARSNPSVNGNLGNGEVTYYYSKDEKAEIGSAYSSTEIPTDAGTYYVKAKIGITENYEQFITTNATKFVITANKLTAVTNLTMSASDTVPYGKYSWDAVPGPEENDGVDSKSSIGVTYQVELLRADTSGAETWASVYKTENPITEPSIDLSSYFKVLGFYKVRVTAISSNTDNCANSDVVTSEELEIKSTASSTENYNRVYNSEPIKLDSAFTTSESEAPSYQWLKNNQEVPGATGTTLDVYDVSDSGTYTCRLTIGDKIYYSSNHIVTITPAPLTIQSKGATKTYDGTELVEHTKYSNIDEVKSNAEMVTGLQTHDAIAYDLNSTITNAGSTSNDITGVVIKRGDVVAYSDDDEDKGDYTVAKTPGTLTVNQRSLGEGTTFGVGLSVADITDITYDGIAHTPEPAVTDTNRPENDRTLIANTDYTYSYSHTTHVNAADAIPTVTITGKGNYSGAITKTFNILQRPITLRSEDKEKVYDGNVLKSIGVGALSITSDTKLAEGDVLSRVTYTASQTDANVILETSNLTSNTYKDIVIQNNSAEDVTKDYAITSQYGTLKVTQASDTIAITNDISKEYDGMAVENPNYTRSGTGTITFEYSTMNESGQYAVLDGAPIHAGTYYVRVREGNDGKNYQASVSDYKEFTIRKRSVTITADDKESVYLETAKDLTYTLSKDGAVTPIVSDADLSSLAIRLTTEASCVNVAKTYDINVSYTENADYEITTVKGIYTIAPATMMVTASGYDATYDALPHTISITANAPSAEDTNRQGTIYYSETELTKDNYETIGTTNINDIAKTDTGTYTIYYYIVADSYVPAADSQQIKIDKATQTLTAADMTTVYDGNTHGITAAVKGVNDTDATVGAITYEKNDQIDVGEYTVSITAAETKNYKLAQITRKLEITQRELELTAGSAIKVYDGQPLTKHEYQITNKAEETEKGLAAGDAITSITYNSSVINVETTPTANHISTVVITDSERIDADKQAAGRDVTSNYKITYKAGELRRTQATGHVSITNTDAFAKMYDNQSVVTPTYTQSQDPTGNGTVTIIYYQKDTSSDNEETWTALDGAPKNAGDYKVVVTVAASQNYTEAEVSQEFTISKRPIIITAAPATSSYSAEPATVLASVTSDNQVCAGDDLQIGAKTQISDTDPTAVTRKTPVGSYLVTPTWIENANYEVTKVNAVYTVTDAAMQYSASGYTGIYDKADHGIDVQVTVPSGATVYYGTENLTDSNYSDKGSTENPTYTGVGTYKVYYYIKAANYTAITGSEDVVITAAQMDVTIENYDRTYDGTAHGLTITPEDPDKITVYYATEALNAENYKEAGLEKPLTYTNAADTADADDVTRTIYYYIIADNYQDRAGSGTVHIARANQTITVQPLLTEYDATKHSVTASVEGVKENDGSLGQITYAGNGQIHAGTFDVTVTAAKTRNYNQATANTQIIITKRPVTFVSDSDQKVYDGNALTKNTYKVGEILHTETNETVINHGLALGDVVDSISITGTITDVGTTDNTISNAVLKNSVAFESTTDVTNDYTITYQPGLLEVTQADGSISITKMPDKTYDKQPVEAPEYTRIGDGEVSISYYIKNSDGSYETEHPLAEAPTDAGDYGMEVTLSATRNYKMYTTGVKDFTIDKRKITIMADDASSIHGQDVSTLPSKVIDGEICSGDDLGIGGATTTATKESPVGTYPITPTYTENQNYDVELVNGTYTIGAAAIVATTEGYEGVYDNQDHGIRVTATEGSTVYFADHLLTTANYLTEGSIINPMYCNAGSYTVYYYISKPNYIPFAGSETIEITRAEQTITAENVTDLIYDGNSHEISATVKGVNDSDESVGAITYMNNRKIHVGTYTVEIKAAQTQNYHAAQTTATLAISQRPVTITADSAEKVYDKEPLSKKSYTISQGENIGLVSGDRIASVLIVGEQIRTGSTQNIISSAIIKNQKGEEVNNDYTIHYINGTLTVTKAETNIAIVKTPDKTYDKQMVTNPVVTQQGDGIVTFVYYEKTESGYEALSDIPVNAGDYGVRAIVEEASDYQTGETDIVGFTIHPRKITITAESVSGSYQAETEQVTARITSPDSVCDGDDLHIGAATDVTDTTVVGIYDIVPTYEPNRNYDVTLVNGKYTILPIEMPYSVTDYVGVYDKMSHSIHVKGTEDYVVYYADHELSETNYEQDGKTASPEYRNVGSYKVYYYIKSSNYEPVKGYGVITITRAKQEVNADNVTIPYDGQSHRIVGTTTGDGILSYEGNDQVQPGTYTVIVKASQTQNYDAAQTTAILTIQEVPAGDVATIKTPIRILTNSKKPSTLSAQPLQSSTNNIESKGLSKDSILDEKIVGTKELSIGNGKIIVYAEQYDKHGNQVDGTIVSSKSVIKACLDEKELEAVRNGETVELRLIVDIEPTEISEEDQDDQDVIATEFEKIKTSDGLTFGMYADIRLEKKIGAAEWKKLKELDSEIEITIDIPEELQHSDAEYYIARSHDATFDLLEDVDDEEKTITIQTKLFSAYAIVYKEANDQKFILFNCIAVLLSLIAMCYIFNEKKKNRWISSVITGTMVILYMIFFEWGILAAFDRMSIIYAIGLLSQTVFIQISESE